ncbi:MAG: alpha/beta hydrolase [Tatlockia sp.]|nr:alpha/beta hydrolase [Tatlockia sp.]
MAGWITGNCEVNGIKLHYTRTGGSKPPIVLLHGLMLNGACWTPLARELEGEFDVIMPDARGHGYSSAPEYGYCYETLGSDVLSLIETLWLTAPVILGHSMGGMTAAVVASRKLQPLAGIILADPTFLTPQQQMEVYETKIAEQHRKVLMKTREDYMAEVEGRHNRRSPELIKLFVQARFQTSIHAFEILKPPNPDYLQLIKSLGVPSLLLFGEVGSVISAEMAAELSGLNSNLKTVQIPKAGHAIPFDQPEAFSVVVQTFLQSLRIQNLV